MLTLRAGRVEVQSPRNARTKGKIRGRLVEVVSFLQQALLGGAIKSSFRVASPSRVASPGRNRQ